MKFLDTQSDIKSNLKQFITSQKYKIGPYSQNCLERSMLFCTYKREHGLISNQTEMIYYRTELIITEFLKGKNKQMKLHRQ